MEPEFLRGKTKNEQISLVWKYLDQMAKHAPEKYNQFIKKTLEDGKKEGLGPPVPGFALHTHKMPKLIPVRDFFVNVCKWEQIPGPKSANDPINMFASEIREELIQNKICLTVDVAVNTGVMDQCLKTKDEKMMLIDLIIRYVETRNNCKLDPNCDVLEEPYKGNRDNLLDMMCPVSLREAAKESSNGFSEEKLMKELKKIDVSGSKDEKELDVKKSHLSTSGAKNVILPCDLSVKKEAFLSESKDEISQRGKGNASDVKNEEKIDEISKGRKEEKCNLRKPEYTRRSEVKGQYKYEVIEVNLPGVFGMNDCDLDVGEDFLELHVPSKFQLHLALDPKIDEDETQAYFIRKHSKLLIKMRLS